MNVKQLKTLLESGGIDINSQDADGNTPLMVALLKPATTKQTIEAFIKCGADITIKNKMGDTALNIITKRQDFLSIESLFSTDIAIANSTPITNPDALIEYIRDQGEWKLRKADIKKVKQMLTDGIDVNRESDSWGSALRQAIIFKDFDVVELLIDKGADVHKISGDGETMLTLACVFDQIETIQMLIDKKVNLNAQKNNGESALTHAIRHDKGAMELLIKAGIDVNMQDKDGETALIQAVDYGDADKVEKLLKAGADIALKNKQGKTATDIAKQNGDVQILKLLKGISKKQTISSTEKFSKDILVKVCSKYEQDAYTPQSSRLSISMNEVKELVKHGADVNALNSDGWSPLMWASRYGDVDMVKFLISKGAILDIQEYKEGKTPMHFACMCNHPKIVELLVNSGAKLDIKDRSKDTPIMEAIVNNSTKSRDILVKSGADISKAKNREGQTAKDMIDEENKTGKWGKMEVLMADLRNGKCVHGQDYGLC